jgi:hypothetical protein
VIRPATAFAWLMLLRTVRTFLKRPEFGGWRWKADAGKAKEERICDDRKGVKSRSFTRWRRRSETGGVASGPRATRLDGVDVCLQSRIVGFARLQFGRESSASCASKRCALFGASDARKSDGLCESDTCLSRRHPAVTVSLLSAACWRVT